VSAHCSHAECKAPIEWVTTEAGAAMPLDIGQFSEGNVRMVPVGEELRAHVVTHEERGRLAVAMSPAPVLYRRAHFSTCPRAKAFRKEKKR
jgi:hypothetical protein